MSLGNFYNFANFATLTLNWPSYIATTRIVVNSLANQKPALKFEPGYLSTNEKPVFCSMKPDAMWNFLPFVESLALHPENRHICYYKVFIGHVAI